MFHEAPNMIIETPATKQAVLRTVERAKQGDPEAFRLLYERYADHIYGYVKSMLHDHHDAEDLTQAVFAKLLTAIGKYHDDHKVAFSAWLLRIARNMAIDHIRRASRVATPSASVVSAPRSIEPGQRDVLRGALANLTEDQQRVVFLTHVAGLSATEIGERMGRSKIAVHNLNSRAHRVLRHDLAA